MSSASTYLLTLYPCLTSLNPSVTATLHDKLLALQVPGGGNWREWWATKARSCDMVIAVLSREYFRSPTCRDELTFARNNGKLIIAVYAETFHWDEVDSEACKMILQSPDHVVHVPSEQLRSFNDNAERWKENMDELSSVCRQINEQRWLDVMCRRVQQHVPCSDIQSASKQAEFVFFCQMILEVIPGLLRECFKAKWNAKYPTYPWLDIPANGAMFFDGTMPPTRHLGCTVQTQMKNDKLSGLVKTSKDRRSQLKGGDTVQLDGHILTVLDCSKATEINLDIAQLKNCTMDTGAEHVLFGQDIKGARRGFDKKRMSGAINTILSGNTSKWEVSVLTWALLDNKDNTSHDLLGGDENEKAIRHLLSDIHNFRNKGFTHTTGFCLPNDDVPYVKRVQAMATEFAVLANTPSVGIKLNETIKRLRSQMESSEPKTFKSKSEAQATGSHPESDEDDTIQRTMSAPTNMGGRAY